MRAGRRPERTADFVTGSALTDLALEFPLPHSSLKDGPSEDPRRKANGVPAIKPSEGILDTRCMKHPTWWLEVNEEAILQHGSKKSLQRKLGKAAMVAQCKQPSLLTEQDERSMLSMQYS